MTLSNSRDWKTIDLLLRCCVSTISTFASLMGVKDLFLMIGKKQVVAYVLSVQANTEAHALLIV